MESFIEIKRTMFTGLLNETHKTGTTDACIMIIDDDLDICETLTALLQDHYRLVSCCNFEDAMKKLIPSVRLVLLDIKMASKDGIEVFKLLREKRAALPIVFHSAYPGSSEKVTALELLNHNGWLTKGEYDLPHLLKVIQHATNQLPEMPNSSLYEAERSPVAERIP